MNAVISKKNEALRERLAKKKESELLEEAVRLYNRAKRLADKPQKLKDTHEQEIEKAAARLKKVKKDIKPVDQVVVGDVINLEKYNKTGCVLEIDGNTAKMDIGGMKISMKLKDLVGKRITETDKVQDVRVSRDVVAGGKSELVLIGKRVEEALDILDKQLDDSVLAGASKLFIVHGRGSGQLRKGVHEFLRTDPRVRKYALATNEEGGHAITVAEI